MANKVDYLDLKKILLQKIKENGGWVNSHAHIDRAYTVTEDNFHLIDASIAEKWRLNDDIKRRSSVDDIYDRMAKAVEWMISQGAYALGTFIDVDEVIKDKSIKAAIRIREKYKSDIKIKYLNQVHNGVLSKESRDWFLRGAEFADIIGGLPSADPSKEPEHLDFLMQTAKEKKKMLHVHVDQLHMQKEKETELLARKTIEHGMQGRVVGIHGSSIPTHPKEYRESLYKIMNEAELMMIVCPTGMVESRPNEELIPSRSPLLPIDELIPNGIIVAMGTDNIYDIYVPICDGDLWSDLKLLISSVRYRNIEELVKIATVNGRKVLGIE